MTEINNADAYVKLQLEDRLNAILNTYNTNDQPYFLDDILSHVGNQAKSNFESSFGGDNPKRSIDVVYSFPQKKTNFDALYMVNQGALSEDTQYISNLGNAYIGRPTYNTVTESLTIQSNGNVCYFTTSNPIAEVARIKGMSSNCYASKDANTIYLNNVGDHIGESFDVTYIPLIDDPRSKDMNGWEIAFNGTESLNIYALSNNMNTLRCLRDILIYILLTLRATEDQDDVFALQKIDSEGISTYPNELLEKPLYAIKFILTYNTEYSASYNIADQLNKINVDLNHTENNGK